ncbi:MAG: Asparagine synthetase (Glutamine-hydrolyzing) 1 [uncultured Sulfurovum sp.]|uniref:asparagine synthase (glutamine-hydrolyzing) n=1 Tax=uncultured Sulfurovum sp. TaxID=269237 RepID=A0A6S6T5Q5_9BACT|nr:MAG: Asparagine synthetase (Glutamine-hydrolyzing) 1 [uncultured Sulfurovum sp.]
MAGIFGGVGLNNYTFKQKSILSYDECFFNDIMYGRKYINKFNGERFIIENSEYIFVFEGFLFDIENFETQQDFLENRINLKNIKNFLNELDGIFSLFLYLKTEEKIILAGDHLASMKLFYSKVGDTFIFSSDLFDITAYYRETAKAMEIDLDATYFFLGFGSIVSNKTLFQNINKLEPSSYLEFDIKLNQISVHKYATLNFEKDHTLLENDIVDKYEELISKAIDRIVNLHSRYNLEYLSGLSGGLDSKSMLIALHQKNIKKITTFTFAEYHSLDQKIAQTVASKLGFIHNFIALDKGNCLQYNFESALKASNGMVALHTLLHSYNSFININTNPFGLLLTGQIGDAIFGSHFIGEKSIKAYITSKSHYGKVPEFIYNKIGFMNELLDEYSHGNSEAYIYEGRISNGTMYGDIILRDSIDSITPFYSKALLDFTLTVPEEHRVGEEIYIKWLKKYHPKVLMFKWDKCDCKPTSKVKVQFLKYIYTIKNAIKKRMKLKYDGMNPFDVWYRENLAILENLDTLYEENIDVLNFNTELKNDVVSLYHSDIDRYKRNKFVVVTLLLSLNLHINGNING